MDLGLYPLHGIRRLLGEEPIAAHTDVVLNPAGADESIDARLTYLSGIQGRVRASMAADYENWIQIAGERGTIRVSGVVFPSAGHSIATTIDDVERVETVAGFQTYDHQLEAVLRALEQGTTLATEGLDPVANMRAVDLIYRAAGMRP